MYPEFIKALLSPSAYSNNVKKIKLIETHISWILLTGKYAYKIKKPICLGFYDGSELDKRIYYCKEELRLNKRLSKGIYIGLVAIRGPAPKARLSESMNIKNI